MAPNALGLGTGYVQWRLGAAQQGQNCISCAVLYLSNAALKRLSYDVLVTLSGLPVSGLLYTGSENGGRTHKHRHTLLSVSPHRTVSGLSAVEKAGGRPG